MSDPNKVGVVGVETIRRAIAVRWTLRVGVGISNERHGTNWEAFPRTLAGFGQSAVTNCSPASRALESAAGFCQAFGVAQGRGTPTTIHPARSRSHVA